MIELVLFDIGAVQLHLNYALFFDQVAGAVSDIERFKREYSHLEARHFTLDGLTARQEFLLGIKGLLGNQQLSDKEVKELLGSAWGGPIEEVMAVKSKVKEKYAVGNCSNITSLQFEMLSERFPQLLEGCLDFPSLYSYRMGATKAEAGVYKQIQGYEPIVFIDDNEKYVRSAVSAGWKGIWFTPYIDQSEAIRSLHSSVSAAPAANFKIVDSTQGLEKALYEFGIKM